MWDTCNPTIQLPPRHSCCSSWPTVYGAPAIVASCPAQAAKLLQAVCLEQATSALLMCAAFARGLPCLSTCPQGKDLGHCALPDFAHHLRFARTRVCLVSHCFFGLVLCHHNSVVENVMNAFAVHSQLIAASFPAHLCIPRWRKGAAVVEQYSLCV